jgi:hypothetical protein
VDDRKNMTYTPMFSDDLGFSKKAYKTCQFSTLGAFEKQMVLETPVIKPSVYNVAAFHAASCLFRAGYRLAYRITGLQQYHTPSETRFAQGHE